jgi:hypothetical protein
MMRQRGRPRRSSMPAVVHNKVKQGKMAKNPLKTFRFFSFLTVHTVANSKAHRSSTRQCSTTTMPMASGEGRSQPGQSHPQKRWTAAARRTLGSSPTAIRASNWSTIGRHHHWHNPSSNLIREQRRAVAAVSSNSHNITSIGVGNQLANQQALAFIDFYCRFG